MEERFQSLAGKIFKKDVSEITNEEVGSLAGQYPYFAPLQFLKLSRSEPGTDAYQEQYQKSILYYPDPLSFDQFLLNGQEFQFESHDPLPPFQDENRFEEVDLVTPVEEPVAIPQVTELDGIHSTVPESHERVDASEDEVPDGFNPEPAVTSVEVEDADVDHEVGKDPEPPLSLSATPPPELNSTELTFEPYHTVDYFASQGIKVTPETLGQDKFGKQVKSFTDWLKTMKRLPLAELGKNVTPTTEKKVENMAEHSVQDADVVTESMAQVWEKQGNIAKATEVYRKLSLQNPSKRAYFAAKIDKLTEEI